MTDRPAGDGIRNPEAEAFFACRCARDEVGTLFIRSLGGLGDYQLRGDLRVFRAPYAVTRGVVFGGAVDMDVVCYRLAPPDRRIALRSGGDAAAAMGREWVRFVLFRPRWPKPDLEHWARAAYRYARTGE